MAEQQHFAAQMAPQEDSFDAEAFGAALSNVAALAQELTRQELQQLLQLVVAGIEWGLVGRKQPAENKTARTRRHGLQ